MFVAGLGIGPTLSVFTIIVQNAVPFAKLGVATSNLTFFRQIGGSVGLAIAGTVFGQTLTDKLPSQTDPVFGAMAAEAPEAARPQIEQFHNLFNQTISSGQGIDLNNQTGVGQSFGEAILHQVPVAFQDFIAPFVPRFDAAFGSAMSLAIAQTFWLAVGATILAFLTALVMRELPLRRTMGAAPAAAPTGKDGDSFSRPAPAAD